MDYKHIDPSHWLSNGKEIIKPERELARNIVRVDGKRGGREYRSLTDPLDFYLHKRQITERQFDAGENLRRLYAKEVQSGYSQSRYEESGTTAFKQHYLPIGIFAVEFGKAMLSIRGESERKVAHAVCCQNVAASRSLEFKSRRTAQRKGFQYLISALDDLADHFKIESKESRRN
jgi:hypothetical protein